MGRSRARGWISCLVCWSLSRQTDAWGSSVTLSFFDYTNLPPVPRGCGWRLYCVGANVQFEAKPMLRTGMLYCRGIRSVFRAEELIQSPKPEEVSTRRDLMMKPKYKSSAMQCALTTANTIRCKPLCPRCRPVRKWSSMYNTLPSQTMQASQTITNPPRHSPPQSPPPSFASPRSFLDMSHSSALRMQR